MYFILFQKVTNCFSKEKSHGIGQRSHGLGPRWLTGTALGFIKPRPSARRSMVQISHTESV
jgi:hypothetical protein